MGLLDLIRSVYVFKDSLSFSLLLDNLDVSAKVGV
jgi:hypothetical protein